MEAIYKDRELVQCIMEEKFLLIKVSDNIFKGKHPLEPFEVGGRGSYGGDFVTQSVLAIWETVSSDFDLHSLHSYFLKAGTLESVMRYEIETNSEGKSYINKSVKVYQDHNNVLAFILTCSFTKNNNNYNRKLAFSKGETKRIPFEFQKKPNWILNKFKKNVIEEDGILPFTHTNEMITHALPMLYVKFDKNQYKDIQIGDRQLGFFVKINDNLPKDPIKNKKFRMADLLFLSDSFYLGIMARNLGIPLAAEYTQFFRVSLDHAVYIHDNDFDPSNWLFLEYQFSRMGNDRVLSIATFYDLNGKSIASVNQEALVNFPESFVKGSIGGNYRL